MKTVREVIARELGKGRLGTWGDYVPEACELLSALKEAGYVCVPVDTQPKFYLNPTPALGDDLTVVSGGKTTAYKYDGHNWKPITASQDQGRG